MADMEDDFGPGTAKGWAEVIRRCHGVEFYTEAVEKERTALIAYDRDAPALETQVGQLKRELEKVEQLKRELELAQDQLTKLRDARDTAREERKNEQAFILEKVEAFVSVFRTVCPNPPL